MALWKQLEELLISLTHKPAPDFDSECESCSVAGSEVQRGVYMCVLT